MRALEKENFCLIHTVQQQERPRSEVSKVNIEIKFRRDRRQRSVRSAVGTYSVSQMSQLPVLSIFSSLLLMVMLLLFSITLSSFRPRESVDPAQVLQPSNLFVADCTLAVAGNGFPEVRRLHTRRGMKLQVCGRSTAICS